jgi:hypothetical protein
MKDEAASTFAIDFSLLSPQPSAYAYPFATFRSDCVSIALAAIFAPYYKQNQ